MGRSSHYRSPCNIKRSSRRLLSHLHRIIRSNVQLQMKNSINGSIDTPMRTRVIRRQNLALVDENTSDTFTNFDYEGILSFYCSTPKKPRKMCKHCKMSVFQGFIEDGTWCQAPFRAAAGRFMEGCHLHISVLNVILLYYNIETVLK